jgi:hypothetical protein
VETKKTPTGWDKFQNPWPVGGGDEPLALVVLMGLELLGLAPSEGS